MILRPDTRFPAEIPSPIASVLRNAETAVLRSGTQPWAGIPSPIASVLWGVLLAGLLLALGGTPVAAQSHPNSPAFRGYRPPRIESPSPQASLERQWTDFMLIRDANAGKSEAQHELGLRYLFGDRFPRDTAKAAMWIGKAADQGLVAAQYNMGLMLMNGSGTEWNPFLAWRMFRAAAEKGFPEAMYLVGAMYTDGLVVARNWREAARWTKKAADAGFAPATSALADMMARGLVAAADTVRADMKLTPVESDARTAERTEPHSPESQQRAREWSPVYLDFGADTARRTPPDLSALWSAVRGTCPLPRRDSLRIECLLRSGCADSLAMDPTVLAPLFEASSAGNADARTLIGRLRDEGRLLERDPLAATEEYIGAMFLDGPNAGPLLYDMVTRQDFMRDLEHRAAAGDVRAQFVVAGLAALGVSRSADESRARSLLARAAARGHAGAMILEGINASTGRWGTRNLDSAAAVWRRAAAGGNREARVRLAALDVMSGVDGQGADRDIAILRDASSAGAVLATVALAYCHERGLGLIRNTGEAARYYREAAIRGSRTAYRSLQRMHDLLRPDDPAYRVE